MGAKCCGWGRRLQNVAAGARVGGCKVGLWGDRFGDE